MVEYDQDNVEIGGRVKALREGYGYSQDVLAEKAGLSTVFISDIESGKKGISAKSAKKLSHALNCSIDFLLLGKQTDASWIQEALARLDPEDCEALERLLLQAVKIVQARPDQR